MTHSALIIDEQLLRRHWRKIRWVTRCIAMQYHIDANDLFGDVLERIWRSRDQFSGDDHAFQQWIVCITYNRCKDIGRSRRTRKDVQAQISLPWAEDDRDEAELYGNTGDPNVALHAREQVRLFLNHISQRHGYFWKRVIIMHAHGYVVKKDEIGNGSGNKYHCYLFDGMRDMRAEFRAMLAPA